MNTNTNIDASLTPKAISIKGVMALYNVGRSTALKIGRESGAGFKIGRCRRYNVEKLNRYMESLTDNQE